MADTYNNLYLDARRELRKAGVEQAQLEARELLCFAADKTREQFLRDLQLYAADSVCARFCELMERRLAGEPMAYIIGEWEFYGLTLDICRDVLIPRSDTETLVERALEYLNGRNDHVRILDLCAGSGCIGLALAHHYPNSTVVLADWSEDALRVAYELVSFRGKDHAFGGTLDNRDAEIGLQFLDRAADIRLGNQQSFRRLVE